MEIDRCHRGGDIRDRWFNHANTGCEHLRSLHRAVRSGQHWNLNGTAVTVGSLGGWTAIGAVQVAGGVDYDVALKNSVSGQYTVWSTDSNGNYLSNVIGAVAGNSLTLESLETTFDQDLNGVHGTIGVPKVAIQTDGSTTSRRHRLVTPTLLTSAVPDRRWNLAAQL